MKSKFLLYISLLIFIGCSNSNLVKRQNLTSNNWFDRYGNEYKFGIEKVEWKPFLYEIWWEIGNYKAKNNFLEISCFQDSSEVHGLKVISIDEERIIFEESLQVCEAIPHVNERQKEFEIWKNRKEIVDKQEKLISLEFKARPSFHYKGIRNFNLNKEKKVEISFINQRSVDTTFIINDTTFNNIENIIQILPLEEFSQEYQFAIIDGVDFDIEVQTNKVSKKINCKGSLPEGLNNLIQYINDELKEVRSRKFFSITKPK